MQGVACGSATLRAFLDSDASGVHVVATLPTDIQAHLDAKTARVLLSSDTRDRHKKHGWTADDFERLQAVLDLGEVRADRDRHVVVAHHDGRWWYAALKIAGNRNEVYLQSFRRSNADQIARFKGRGTLVRTGR